jgi:CubicO group peptidase (beta-lactamase class C family)
MDRIGGGGRPAPSGNTKRVRLATACLAAWLLAGVDGGLAAANSGDSGVLAALGHGLRPTVIPAGEALPGWSLEERLAHYHVPGVAIAVLRGGEVVEVAGYGLREAGGHDAVDGDTLFSVGSISKVVTAAISLRLVAQGKVDLDRDVNGYLTSWRVPPASGIADPAVTMRMLMSHTSGLNVHGFADYLPGESLPTLLDTLEGRSPAKNDAVRLQRQPGLLDDYSGGGVMVEQLVIEDVTGASLEAVAREQVFAPLGLSRSTFESPLSAAHGNIAKAHDGDGSLTALPRGWQTFPQQAASGLWSSAKELGTLVGALIKSYQGRDPFLPRVVAVQMMTEVSPSWHGLGPRLEGAGTTRVFHHGGANDSYRSWIEGYLETGDGFVILTNGEGGGGLRVEIRNALSDAIGRGVNPPLRAIALAAGSVPLTDYAGIYRADAAVPMDLRRALTDLLDVETFEIEVEGEALSIVLPDETGALLPLTPTRFVAPTVFGIQLEFHHDAHGAVRAASVELGASRAYFRRQGSGRAGERSERAVAGPSPPEDTTVAIGQIKGVIEAFRTSIIAKDKVRFVSLFLHPGATWQAVKSDERLQRLRQAEPDVVKVRVHPEGNYLSFIDGIVAASERREEKFSNVAIDTDGDIAAVTFDYSFEAGGRETNRGKEAWQLVNTGDGWKIVSVIWSARDSPG